MFKYVVIFTDYGDTCDGLARQLITTCELEAAEKEMTADVKQYLEDNENMRKVKEGPGFVYVSDGCENGCQWQILTVEV